MSEKPTARPGDVIAGKYRVERVLGAGGMGYVVAARHLQLDQLVAMKFLRKDAADSPEAATRFLREAQAVSMLRGEHVARIHDVGAVATGQPYIVMEYLEGQDLSMLVKDRAVLPVAEACDYVLQVCEALAEAHAVGIIHRDIKLANIFVTRGPTGMPLVKVLDFGISKSSLVAAYEPEVTNAASLLGSPRFMSPEQMRDPRGVDPRTDIWSLGVVLYRVLAGRPPFEADALGRLIALVMHGAPAPLASVRADVPSELDRVVARCLEKDPAKRFPNVAALAAALVPFCADRTRARFAAERIEAIHALPRVSVAPRASNGIAAPPARDSGTNAPWAVTGARSRRGRSANAAATGLLVFAIALAGLGIRWRPRIVTAAAPPPAETVLAAPSASAVPAKAR